MASLPKPLIIAQLSDIHLFDDPEAKLLNVKTEESFQEVLEELTKLSPQPDLLLLTGDLTQDGSEPAYARMQSTLINSRIPAYCLPGNHDEAVFLQTCQSGEQIGSNRRITIAGWQLFLLNSAIAGKVQGYFHTATLNWLDQQLAASPDLPALIAFHHPALSLGCAWLDPIGLENQEQFWQVCDRHPQVRVVINGHAHQAFDTLYCRTNHPIRYLVTPSTCIQFQPLNDQFQIDDLPPGFRLLYLYADGTVDTKVCYLDHSRFRPNLAAVGY